MKIGTLLANANSFSLFKEGIQLILEVKPSKLEPCKTYRLSATGSVGTIYESILNILSSKHWC